MNLLVNPIFERWPQETLVVESDQGTRKEKQPVKGMLSSKFTAGHQWSLIPLEELCKPIQMAFSRLSSSKKRNWEYLDTDCISLEMWSAPGGIFDILSLPGLWAAGSSIQHKLKGRQLKVRPARWQPPSQDGTVRKMGRDRHILQAKWIMS